MAQTHFVQIPCAKCGTTVWIAPAAGVGYCPSCHTPNQLPPGAAAGAAAAPAAGYGAPAAGQQYGAPAAGYGAPAAGYGAPAGGAPAGGAPQYGAPAGMPYAAQAPAGMTGVAMKPPGFPVMKIVGAIGLAIVVGGLSIGGNILRNKFKPGKASTSTYGIDSKKAEPDKMIGAAGTLAKKWRGDAVFWKMNISQMGADGTVDLNKTNVVIEYFSPSGVSASVPKLREDSIKKFNFVNGTDILYADRYSPTGRGWNPPPPATPMPGCNTKMLAAKLAAKGVTGSKTVQVTLDPESGKGPAWVVQMDGGPQYFDLNTCNQKLEVGCGVEAMIHTRALPLALLAASIVGCGGRTGRARFSAGEDARDGLDASMQKSGVLLSPLNDPPDAPAGGERVTCLEEANGAVERVLKQRYTVTVVLPSAKDDPTPTWPKLPRWVKEADGSRYVARVESARCTATGAEVALSLVDREEGKTLMRTVGESSRERGAAGREAATVAAQKLAFGRLP